MRETLAGRLPDPAPVLVALAAGIAAVAGSFAVAGFTPAFVAGPIAGWLARGLPAALITFAIVVLGDLGATLNVALALGLAVGLLSSTALVGSMAGRHAGSQALGSAVAAVLTGGAAVVVTGATLPSLVAGLAAGFVLSLAGVGGTSATLAGVSSARRRVITGTAGAAAFVLGGYALGTRVSPTGAPSNRSAPLDVPSSVRDEIVDRLDQAAARSLDIEGIEPLVSERFYQVDINATNPRVEADDWTLSVTGFVDEERTYTYDDLRAFEPENRFNTLRCVGESLNGHKQDNALWTGVPIMDLVEPAGVESGCCVMLRAVDGFYEEFPLSALRDGFLAYGMNGDVLPRAHGYPARALIPGHWGEINVKWLTEIEILEKEAVGYWEERGWHGTGPVNTIAKLHAVNRLADGRIEVGGHAYAGTRGIQTVEVSTDGGTTWVEATLSEALPGDVRRSSTPTSQPEPQGRSGDDVWRQWVHRYEPPAGSHEVVVRAIDGEGVLQPREESGAFPSGPSGWVSRTVRP